MTPAPLHRLDQRQAVEPRQHAVDDENVIALPCRMEQGILAVMQNVARVAALGEATRDVVGGLPVIFDQEYSHMGSGYAFARFRSKGGGCVG